MHRTLIHFSLPFVALILAADPAWTTKPLPLWDQRDARQVLANSPWVKFVIPAPIPAVSEAQHRDGGTMGGNSKGVGLRALAPSNLFGVGTSTEAESRPLRPVAIRWESSLPVRTAEARAGEQKLPESADEYYVIAVYGIPAKLNRKDIEGELRRTAFLQLDGKKTIKPARIDISRSDSGLARIIYYLFPRSPRITTGHRRIEFMAQFESLYVAQFFFPQEMYFQGKLEL